MKICVIGSGISGLSVANMLHQKHEVTLYEKEKQIGGLIKCTREEGNLFHRVGGHVFNSKNKEVLDWFWSFFDKDEFVSTIRKAKIFMYDQYLGYPIENNLYKLPKDIVNKVIEELLEEQTTTNYINFEDFLRGNFGNTLYDIYFKPYNEKIWNTDLKQVPLDWLEGKLPMPNIKEIILSNIFKEEETKMVHSSFYYPKSNGSQFIVDRLSEALNIVTNSQITKIEKVTHGWQVNDTFFDCVIYTGDIRELSKLINHPSTTLANTLDKTMSFKSNGTSNVLCYTNDDRDISWLYFPEKSFVPHRIIYTGNFSKTNNAGQRKTCVVEFSGIQKQEVMLTELEKMPGNLEPIAFNMEPNSYVINTFDTRTIVNSVKEELEDDKLFLLGRFAEWEYYNMDKCIEAAFKLVEDLS
jgi:protoporphyrinogen oxidase